MSSSNLFAFAVAAFLALPAAAWEPEVVGLEDNAARIATASPMLAAVGPTTLVEPEVIGMGPVNAPATAGRAARQDPPGRATTSSAERGRLASDCGCR